MDEAEVEVEEVYVRPRDRGIINVFIELFCTIIITAKKRKLYFVLLLLVLLHYYYQEIGLFIFAFASLLR